MEQDAIDQAEAREQAYTFYMRNDPGSKELLGPIEVVDDPVTGREMRRRDARVAPIRGAKPESMRPMTVWLDPVPHIRLEKPKDLQGWYSSKGDGAKPGQRERPCYTDAILTQPYGGWCSVGCHSFCYVMAGHYGYRASGLTSVPIGYGDYVERTLRTMKIGQAGYFSSFTDPFMEIEDWYHNTQRGAEAFDRAGLPVFFLSRRAYPGWAFDLLTRNRYSYMQKSINTPDQDVWAMLSPGAASLDVHFEQIAEARRRGIYVSIQVNPVIPGLVNHEDIERLIELLAQAGANHVIVKFVESNHAWRRSMVDKMYTRFGANRMGNFRELMSESQDGAQTTIQEDYRREGHERYSRAATRLGMTYATCYEYGRTADGKGWRSIGGDYLTADQCHGHRVPTHISVGGTFQPLEVCPPSGCLTCADEHNGPKCGSTLLGSAKALRLPDMRRDPGVRA